MADFCKTCSLVMFGSDTKDLAALMPEELYTDDLGAIALCECCGPIVVDYDGARMSQEFYASCDCAEHGSKQAVSQEDV